ncbi:selenium-dependent molybdenum cofactor biosynthesis protein YqeB [Pseudodesulfovibrio senegalensis]|jgi:xanthine dehydrogenase accessory factor|uniref:EF2563 family selenium-dependent molybdenum hydroxylase system protein n=1 Tax=Pseudodesulfovibrio senegalensis TaxID=1721087 RepID=A0A6N6N6L9_9BACT|nr:selenium-dependent molybdenum cofactor biosynthesis protein YqeB [Pseudodesulfovibrio senegalensis]KAB1443125.1 EF2563 family selenium-dependent molybdenum hydroxylase system protein [Pseudodesulfovibrio senegalensis]
MQKLNDLIFAIRSAGDIASGVIMRLYNAGFRNIVMLETPEPLTVRRKAAFSEAVRLGTVSVENVTARLVAVEDAMTGIRACWDAGELPVLADPQGTVLKELKPDVVVDALIAKRNRLGTSTDDAPLVIALGPGFEAGKDAHAVIETQRGHNMGRVIRQGQAAPNSGIPGNIGGKTIERLLRAPCDGEFLTDRDIGDRVRQGDMVATVGGEPVYAKIDGVLRGLLRSHTPARTGLKLGDIDPRDNPTFCNTVSDKALAIGGGVLEAVLARFLSGNAVCPQQGGRS